MTMQTDSDRAVNPPNPGPELDPMSRTIAQILEIIPDVEPQYLLGLVEKHLPKFADQTMEHVLELLFEDGGYPKGKGKRKAKDVGMGDKKVKVDYASDERPFPGGPAYSELALVQLQTSFAKIPKPYLRQELQRYRGLYAPTHLALATAEKAYVAAVRRGHHSGRPYTIKSKRYNPQKDRERMRDEMDEAFAEEKKWLVQHLQDRDETDDMIVGVAVEEERRQRRTNKGKAKAVVDEASDDGTPVETGSGIECQCCFAEYAFAKMVVCPEAHPFCSECVSQYASTKLGEHDPEIICMHVSGCVQPFAASELRRVLSTTLMDLFERVKQRKEIESADLEGLEGCPFCDWKCVLEVSKAEEKLFRCGNEEGGCGVISCRMCKKDEHLPKSCKEVDDELLFGNGRLWIEEAMSRALMRNCPKCDKAFIKAAGCNAMKCPNCHTNSCYVCRKAIQGYNHFDPSGKCPQHDDVEKRHEAEVKAAAKKALKEYKHDHPTADEGFLEGVLKSI